jgi:enoyl-CoA hydratase/carnithine racemase
LREEAVAEDNFVLYECADRVATISLNRPEKLNAVSDEVVAQLADALRRFDLDPEAEVAILTGKGRAFSSGADVPSGNYAAATSSRNSVARKAGAPTRPTS